jgi:hypothetical protein
MLSWLRKSRALAAEFCERCAKVCAASCRAAAVRDQALLRALRFGMRI